MFGTSVVSTLMLLSHKCINHHTTLQEGGSLVLVSTVSNIDFFLKILPLKDDELVMSEM